MLRSWSTKHAGSILRRMQADRVREAGGWLLPTLVALFFFSGISGLIYQVLWLRLLALIFGVTVWAASTVLASFMAGLALGSFVAGRLVDRAHHPLRWYGVAEVLIGLSALATPVALDGVEHLYVSLSRALPDSLVLFTLLRFLLAFAVLMVPTTLMGATLPIVVKSSLLRTARLGERIGLLYATNTAGAVVGALLAGFYLLGSVGISTSFYLAATINVLVGGVAIVASLIRPVPTFDTGFSAPDGVHASPTREAAGDAIPDRSRRLVLLIFALSGFASLALEVIWFRVLVLFLDVSTYAFTIMLASVLSGIAAGSYLITPLMRRRLDWLALLAAIELPCSRSVDSLIARLCSPWLRPSSLVRAWPSSR
jgi:spermidine synthase